MRGLRPLWGRCPGVTLKPEYNDPFNNKISAIKNIISSPSVVNSIVKIPSNNEIPAVKNKVFGPFRFIILRFPCMTSDGSRKRKKEKNGTKGTEAYGVGCPKG
jgi:hypothetical protein